jgi:hypothetical protein
MMYLGKALVLKSVHHCLAQARGLEMAGQSEMKLLHLPQAREKLLYWSHPVRKEL